MPDRRVRQVLPVRVTRSRLACRGRLENGPVRVTVGLARARLVRRDATPIALAVLSATRFELVRRGAARVKTGRYLLLRRIRRHGHLKTVREAVVLR